jgi:hypothetical protein
MRGAFACAMPWEKTPELKFHRLARRSNPDSSHEPQCSSDTVTGDAQIALAREPHLVEVTGYDINKPLQILDPARVEISRSRGRR